MNEGTYIQCSTGAVATGPPEGAQAGAAILERGGNAIDAAAAACLACAVTEPQAVDIGGYVFAAVVVEGGTGHVWSVDANTVAPAAATPDMFRNIPLDPSRRGVNEREWGCSVEDDANFYGPLAVSVPGFLGGVGAMWENWGRLRWPEIVEPARRLVERGLPYSRVQKDIDFKRGAISRYPSTVAFLSDGAGDRFLSPKQAVERPDDALWFRPDLGRTLDRIAAAGWRDLYTGELGRAVADFVQSQGGILTREDMAGFEPRITEPCSSTYRGAVVHTAIAPNGGFSVLEALAQLDREALPRDSDPAYWATMAKTLAHMWTNRLAGAPPTGASPHGTVHVAAVDRHRNLVSATISTGGLFGACLAVPGTGIILSHGMCRFDPHPGSANSVGPGKRPLNNVCPLILRMPRRDVAIGTRGGRRIVSVAVQLAQRIVGGASVYEAAVAPRIHTLTGSPVEISTNFDPGIRAALERSGIRIEVPDEVAGAAHGAEFVKPDGQLSAGGNTWAAGI